MEIKKKEEEGGRGTGSRLDPIQFDDLVKVVHVLVCSCSDQIIGSHTKMANLTGSFAM